LGVLALVWCLSASRAQFRQRVAEQGALGDWASHLGLNSRMRSSGCPAVVVSEGWNTRGQEKG
jgi:hypothetical protein